MRLTITIFVFLVLNAPSCIHAGKSSSTGAISDPVTRKLFIDPSSTSLLLGKARLIVSPLTHRNGNYVGDYQLKVRPYFFKSETGTLLLAASMIRFGSSRRAKRLILLVRRSRAK